MKKYLISALLILSVLFAPASSASATTIDDLQAQIAALMAQLNALQAQQTGGSTTGTEITTGDGTGNSSCFTFTQNLKFGDGSDSYTEPMVRALQADLEREGFSIFMNEKKGGSIFGESTASAVSSFQQKYASDILYPNGLTSGNGFVGASTRAKLNALYGCGTTTGTTTTNGVSLSANNVYGSTTLQAGQSVTLNWKYDNIKMGCDLGTTDGPYNKLASSPAGSGHGSYVVTGLQKSVTYVVGCDKDGYQSKVTVNVSNPIDNSAATLVPSSTFVNYNWTMGDPIPQPVSLTLFNQSATRSIHFNILTPNQPSWLNAGYAKETLPISPSGVMGLGVSVDPSKLSAGTYSYDIGLSGDFANSPTSIHITLTVNSTLAVAPTVNLTANYSSNSININSGDPVTLRWTYTNATTCNTSWKYGGEGKDADTIYPTASGSYTVTCSGAGGTSSATVNVNVASTPTPSAQNAYGIPYNQTSSTPLSGDEQTVQYVYPSNACGTLMSSYTAPGSVQVGSGPVYNLAAQDCAGLGSTPNTNTFRVYSCENLQTSSGAIQGEATFAFKCMSTQASSVLNGISQLLNQIRNELKTLR